mgnify:CR=1 FL=1
MAEAARPLEIQQLENHLKQEFNGLITGTGHSALDKERNFLSKAVAACFLMEHAGVDKQAAVDSCVDGGGDNGIDSIYIGPTNVIWLIQSKYIHDGSGEPSLGDAGLFRDGVNAIFDGQFHLCKTLSAEMVSRLRRVMGEPHQVVFALVYTGTSMDESRRTMFGNVVQRVNSVAPGRARFVRFGLSDFHEALTQRFAEPEINDVQIELYNYGLISGAARAFYGSMFVKDLAALYLEKGNALVQENIRRYRGSSEVNEAMTLTLKNEAAKFFYFNNGVTLICRSIRPDVLDATRARGVFHLDGVSIINGAQTVGTVAQEPLAHYDAHPAQVLVTCIELPAEDSGFADDVTRYRNSQNAVSPQDFAALDDNQECWRRTLQSEGVTYIVKRSAVDGPADDNTFTLLDAAEARALRGVAGLNMLIGHPARLWDRTQDMGGNNATPENPSAYKLLFPDSLTARHLWRTVQIARFVRRTIEQDAASMASEHEADIARNSVRLLTHVLLVHCRALCDGESLSLGNTEIAALSYALDKARGALVQVYPQIETAQRSPSEVFVDMTTLNALKAPLMQALKA